MGQPKMQRTKIQKTKIQTSLCIHRSVCEDASLTGRSNSFQIGDVRQVRVRPYHQGTGVLLRKHGLPKSLSEDHPPLLQHGSLVRGYHSQVVPRRTQHQGTRVGLAHATSRQLGTSILTFSFLTLALSTFLNLSRTPIRPHLNRVKPISWIKWKSSSNGWKTPKRKRRRKAMKKRRTKVIVCPDAHFGHHTLDLTPHKHTHSHNFPFCFRRWI